MSDQQKLFTQQVDLLLYFLNQQRHDWLNHFQVLLGYLKLGRAEEGEAYLRRVTEEIQQESGIARINSPFLSVFFLTFNALHNDLRLQVEADDQLDLTRLAMEQETFSRLLIDLVYAVQQHLVEGQHEQPSLLVSLANGRGHVTIRFDLVGEFNSSGQTAVESLLNEVRQYGGTVANWIHKQGEWVLEMKFACRT
ncbi:Spo0B domain-containing protein [Brevibacillus humidisoli]|uniref:Spo0B domain-containing protein n=1 Tax=Brevibacillus humidisoli TaxID=2895522 RepID=UPI001E6111D0|nr:Spo0B domain-containing protein [Brevibacillus humidisoli]UFJ39043.1 Spo0B domain-containing protein [Brevibacillus humidisoli]